MTAGPAIDLVLASVFLLATVYQLYAWLLLRRRETLWFALLAGAFACFTVVDSRWIGVLTGDPSVVLRLHAVLAHLITASFLRFLWLFFARTPGRLMRLYMLSHAVLAAAALVAPASWIAASAPFRWLWILPAVIAVAWLGVDSLRRRHPDARTVGLGTLAAVLLGSVLMTGHVLGLDPSRQPKPAWGFAVFLAFFAAGLARRTARLTRELEAANRRLERRVEENRAALVDISEQRRARQALEESERRYRQFVDNSPGLICVHDLEGRLRSVNPAAARLLGAPAEEMVGRDLRHVVDPAVTRLVDAYLAELAREGEASGLMRVRTRAGASRLILFRTTVIEEQGRPPQALGFGQDVSDLKEAERELRSSFEAMRDLNRIAAAPGVTFGERLNALLDLGRQRFDLACGVFCHRQGDQVRMLRSRDAGTLSGEAGDGGDAYRRLCDTVRSRTVARERSQGPGGDPPLEIGGRPAEALLATPVRVGGRVAGVLAFYDPAPRDRAFDAGEIEFLKLMALWVGAQLEYQQRTSDAGRLAEMSELLQSCGSLDEAHGVVSRLAAQFFPELGGSLLIARRGDGLVEVATWGDGRSGSGDETWRSADCWAARRGREHWVEDASTGLVCRHVGDAPPASFLCVPMMAMGDLVGVLHLRPRSDGAGSAGSATRLVRADRRLAASVAEHAALALANLELREDLRRQSIHDALTGAFNRRHLDRRLLEECRRVTRTQEPLSLLLLDIDGFKAFNDTYGHQAGDRCLCRVVELLQRRLRRTGDLVARYGGEEFVAVLPGTDAARAALLADHVRHDVEELAIPDVNSPFGVVTVSIGAGTWLPNGVDGPEPDALVASADRALYEAKAGGRNRVISREPG